MADEQDSIDIDKYQRMFFNDDEAAQPDKTSDDDAEMDVVAEEADKSLNVSQYQGLLEDSQQHPSPYQTSASRPTTPRPGHQTTLYSAITTDTGIDRTGTLDLGFSIARDHTRHLTQYEEETQRDPDSFHDQVQKSMINLISERRASSLGPDIYWDMKDADNEETQEPTQCSPEVNRFDESKRWQEEGEERSAKRRRTSGHFTDEAAATPLADMEPKAPDLTLSQLFDASSPPPRVNIDIPTSPRFGFSPSQILPRELIADKTPSSPPPPPPRIPSDPITEYRTINESQKRRRATRILSGSDDDDSDSESLGVEARRRRRENQERKAHNELFMNIKAPPRPEHEKRKAGRPRKVEVVTSSSIHINSNAKEIKGGTERMKNGRNKNIAEVSESTKPISPSSVEIVQETAILEQGLGAQDAELHEQNSTGIVQVPSTTRKEIYNRSMHVISDDTPAPQRIMRQYVPDMQTSSPPPSIDGDLPPTQDTAIADSQSHLYMSTNCLDIPSQINGEAMVVESSMKDSAHNLRQDTSIDMEMQEILATSAKFESKNSDTRNINTNLRKTRQRNVIESSPFVAPFLQQELSIRSSPPVLRNVQIVSHTTHVSESSGTVRPSSGNEEPSNVAASNMSEYETAQQSHQMLAPAKPQVLETPYPAKSIRAFNPTTIPETSPRERYEDAFSPLAGLVNGRVKKRDSKATELPSSIPDSILRRSTRNQGQLVVSTEDEEFLARCNASIPKPSLDIPVETEPLPVVKRGRPSALRRVSGFKEIQDSLEAASVTTDDTVKTGARKPSLLTDKVPSPSRASSPISSPPPSTPASDTPQQQLTADSLANLANVTPTPNPNRGSFMRSNPVEGPRETCPKRVFAHFKGANYMYYSATLKNAVTATPGGTAIEARSKVVFDDGQESVLPNSKIRRCLLETGDIVKVNKLGLKNKTWTVQELKTTPLTPGTPLNSVNVKNSFTDIYGHNLVVLKQRSTRKSANTADEDEDGEIKEVLITDVYLTSAQWHQLESRTPFVQATAPQSPARTGSVQSTPSSKMRRAASIMLGIKPEPENGIGLGLSTGVEALFSHMVFAVSYGDKEGEKKAITSKINSNGGTILEEGFQSLFVQGSAAYSAALKINDEKAGAGFTCVIADRHSRTPKYLQALALGFPCLAGKWVDDCVKKGAVVPWEDYLLPSGESSHLNGAIKSRVLAPTAATSTHLSTTFHNRRQLFQDKNLIFVMSKGKADERRKPHLFLVHAMGAAAVVKVFSMEEAITLVKEGKYDYLISKTGGKVDVKIRRRARVVEDEWMIQSLILGRLIEEDDF